MIIEYLRSTISNEILRAFALFLLASISFKIIAFLLEFLMKKIAKITETEVDDVILKKWKTPINLLIVLASIFLVLNEVTLNPKIKPTIDHILFTATSLVVIYIIYVAIDVIFIRASKHITTRTQTTFDDTLLHIIHSSLKWAFIVISILYVLSIWGVEISPLLASLGIAGIAVALALQQTLSNVFAGISLIADRTFRVGDIIKLDTGEIGEVFSITLRSTRIKTFDNEMIIIPNSVIANAKIQNLLLPDPTIRVNIDFSVEYGTDPEYVKQIILDEMNSINLIDKSKEIRILFMSMSENSLDFRVMFWVDHIDKKWPAHQEAITKIYRRLYKEGIGIPFPQRTIWLRHDNAKAPSPFDEKFAPTRDKIYPWFGYENENKKIDEAVIAKSKQSLKDFIKKIKEKKYIKKLKGLKKLKKNKT